MATLADPFNDLDALTTATVVLPHPCLSWAKAICQQISEDEAQWQAVLRAIAVAGFDQWLCQNASLVGIYEDHQVPVSGVNLRVGDHRLCVLAMGSLSDDRVTVPIETTVGAAAHLYVLTEVQEEIGWVRIVAGLRREQLLPQLETLPACDPTLDVPLRCFDVAPEQILLILGRPPMSHFPADKREVSSDSGY